MECSAFGLTRDEMIRLVVTVVMVLASVTVTDARPVDQHIEDKIAAFINRARPSAQVKVEGITLSGVVSEAAPESVVMTAGTIPGRATFSLVFADGGRIHATAMIRLSERVVMPRRPFNKGYTLREEDVYEAFMDATRIPRDAVPNISDVIGKPLTRSIVSNAPISKDMISEASVVRSGAAVTLLFEGAGFVIRTTGELKQRGTVGEYVRVMNISSRKILTGLLLDEATVKVEL